MAALKDQWQEQRIQRQQELAQRQQAVQETLAGFNQKRQAVAAQLRDELSEFQRSLQQNTQTFLTTAQQQRLAQAQELAALLQAFKQTLQEETAQFLAVSAADRSLMAQQLFQELSAFRNRLTTSTAALRQVLQTRIAAIRDEMLALKADTQQMLSGYTQRRLQEQMQLAQELAAFMETLQVEVQTYLSELSLQRQERAQDLQTLLQADRMRRSLEMDALMQEFSAFRADLQQYCANLRDSVWGGGSAPPAAPKTTPVKATQPATAVRTVAKPKATSRAASLKSRTVGFKPAAKSVKVPVGAPAALPSVALVTVPPISEVPAPTPEPAPVMVKPGDVIQLPQPEGLNLVAPTSAPKPINRDSAQIEKEIYTYIHETKGSRLTEIEAALEINRFQAVDALRSLIKKGLVTQRDRIYLIQEEVNL